MSIAEALLSAATIPACALLLTVVTVTAATLAIVFRALRGTTSAQRAGILRAVADVVRALRGRRP
ncbi:hypothetical protein ACWGE1_06695 [Streptomyces sp. NPDC054932]